MVSQVFEANSELQEYLFSLEFADVTEKYNPNKPRKKVFKKKAILIEFDYINIAISKSGGMIFWDPVIEKTKLDSLLKIRSCSHL